MTLNSDSLFNRLLTLHGPSIKRMLTIRAIQYRMHGVSRLTKCTARAEAVKARLLTSLPYVLETLSDG